MLPIAVHQTENVFTKTITRTTPKKVAKVTPRKLKQYHHNWIQPAIQLPLFTWSYLATTQESLFHNFLYVTPTLSHTCQKHRFQSSSHGTYHSHTTLLVKQCISLKNIIKFNSETPNTHNCDWLPTVPFFLQTLTTFTRRPHQHNLLLPSIT